MSDDNHEPLNSEDLEDDFLSFPRHQSVGTIGID
jgi:hypothetical protein